MLCVVTTEDKLPGKGREGEDVEGGRNVGERERANPRDQRVCGEEGRGVGTESAPENHTSEGGRERQREERTNTADQMEGEEGGVGRERKRNPQISFCRPVLTFLPYVTFVVCNNSKYETF